MLLLALLTSSLLEMLETGFFVDIANAVEADFGFLPLLAFTGMVMSMKLVFESVWLSTTNSLFR